MKNDREDWIVVKGMHEPIISEELFEQAQKALHSRKIQPRKDSPHHVDPDVFLDCSAAKPAERQCGNTAHITGSIFIMYADAITSRGNSPAQAITSTAM